MRLLLQRRIPGLGEIGDVVEISDGYGRNYLLPQRLAVANTPDNRRQIETQKLFAIQQETKRQELAGLVGKDLKNALLQVHVKAQPDGSLYGSVNAAQVVRAIEAAKGYRVEERWVQMDGPIKKIGDYDLSLKLPDDDECSFKLTVLPEEEQS